MKITPGVGVAIGLGVAAAAVGIGFALGAHRHDSPTATPYPGPFPSPRPGPAPTPSPTARPDEIGGTTVADLAAQFTGHYDHSRDGVIDIRWGQQFGTDERVTGEVGNIHTMVGFFREADVDGDMQVTDTELRDAIATFDTRGTRGFSPGASELGDGYLGIQELQAFADHAYGAFSDAGDPRDEFGVSQIITVDGERRNNEGFFDALPEYRARS